MSRRRVLAIALAAGLVMVAAAGLGWEYHRLDAYRPLDGVYTFGYSRGGGWHTTYMIPDMAYGRYAGRTVEVTAVGAGPSWLGFTIANQGDHAVTITGLEQPATSDRGAHLRVLGLLSPAGYEGSPDAGQRTLAPPIPFHPTTVPAHASRWIGARFATTSCADVTGSKRFVISSLPLRIHYLRVFDATQIVQMPIIAVATCGPFHPVLNP